MKIKHTLLAVLISWFLVFIGALFKINHSEYSSYLLTTGMATSIIGGLAFIYKMLSHPKVKEFLNS